MNKITTEQRIENFLRIATNDKNIYCHENTPNSYFLFLSLQDKLTFLTKGYETFSLELWSTPMNINKKKLQYGFSFWNHDPGVAYHRDGSGTPPSDELVEYKDTFKSMLSLLKKTSEYINQVKVSNAEEAWI